MDWQGQKLAEQLMQILLLAFGVVAFIVGYSTASFRMMMLVYAGGVVLTTLVTVPNWSFFNRHPLKWLDPIEAEKHPKPQPAVSSKKKNSKNLGSRYSTSFPHQQKVKLLLSIGCGFAFRLILGELQPQVIFREAKTGLLSEFGSGSEETSKF